MPKVWTPCDGAMTSPAPSGRPSRPSRPRVRALESSANSRAVHQPGAARHDLQAHGPAARKRARKEVRHSYQSLADRGERPNSELLTFHFSLFSSGCRAFSNRASPERGAHRYGWPPRVAGLNCHALAAETSMRSLSDGVSPAWSRTRTTRPNSSTTTSIADVVGLLSAFPSDRQLRVDQHGGVHCHVRGGEDGVGGHGAAHASAPRRPAPGRAAACETTAPRRNAPGSIAASAGQRRRCQSMSGALDEPGRDGRLATTPRTVGSRVKTPHPGRLSPRPRRRIRTSRPGR